jgi:hypothetical protein
MVRLRTELNIPRIFLDLYLSEIGIIHVEMPLPKNLPKCEITRN